MITIKIKLNNKVRSLAIEGSISYKTLKRFCIDMFGETLKDEQSFIITYVDDEGDIISIGSDVELKESFRVMSQKNNVMTYTIVKIEEEDDEEVNEKSMDVEIKNVETLNPKLDEDVRKLEESIHRIEDALNQHPKIVEEETKELKEKIAEFFNSLKEKIQQFSLEFDERFVIPVSNSLKMSFDDISTEVRKLKEELRRIKKQMEEGINGAVVTIKNDISNAKKTIKEKMKREEEGKKKEEEEEKRLNEEEEDECAEVKSDLAILDEMGFNDIKRNLELLAKYPNELDKVIEELLRN